MAIEAGKSVWLKSGGPKMSAKHKTVSGNWLCTWFKDDEVKEHDFEEAQLTDENPDIDMSDLV